ncbi:hypothetical protein [Streptomyces tsukubensis]|uniref:hypothetical protein n=1 Tax=Streptomyces tsukubensis TaxID=83656 RepID=UPI00344B8E77
MNHEVACLVLASIACARAFAPDVRIALRRLLSAGVRAGTATLMEHQRPTHITDRHSHHRGGER